MLRSIAAVVLGYIVLFVFVAASFSALYAATGPAFAWEPGTTHASLSWMTVAILLSFIAAILGGWMAGWIGRSWKTVVALAALVLVLGIVNAVAVRGVVRVLPEGRTAESLSMSEAARYTNQPDWYNFVVPLIGVAGVLVGGRLRLRGPLPAPAPAAA